MTKLNLNDIKEFLKTKGIIWHGLIYDPFKDAKCFKKIDFFDNERIVRLYVNKEGNENEYIQRVIISSKKFLVENEKLNKLDNFVSYSEEWKNFRKLKYLSKNTKIKHMVKDIYALEPNTNIDFEQYFEKYMVNEQDKIDYFYTLMNKIKDFVSIKDNKYEEIGKPYKFTIVRNENILSKQEKSNDQLELLN